jgi:CheY-like chemotaxis protein
MQGGRYTRVENALGLEETAMATILIVDDQAANRQVLVALLHHQGHRLLQAANGSEGLAVDRTEHPLCVPVSNSNRVVCDNSPRVVTRLRDSKTKTSPRGDRPAPWIGRVMVGVMASTTRLVLAHQMSAVS